MVMKHVDWHIFNGTMALIVTFLQKSESLIQSRKWRKKVFSVKGALNIEGHQIPFIEKGDCQGKERIEWRACCYLIY